MKNTKRTLAALVIASATAAACAAGLRGNPERPPAPVEVELAPVFGTEDMRQLMWQLAHRVERINVILRRDPIFPVSAVERTEIVDHLTGMEAIAARLASRDGRQVHPMIGRHIEEFQNDIHLARLHASANPPNFFMAGSIAGACANCHGVGFDKLGVGDRPR